MKPVQNQYTVKRDHILREKLVEIALAWQDKFGVAPSVTSSISEYDAAVLIGMTEDEYSEYMQDRTAVSRGHDFIFRGIRYQIKATRPSGRPGSKVTNVPNPTNREWDKVIWVSYDKDYKMLEAWEWDIESFNKRFQPKERLSPKHYRQGQCLYKHKRL
jgi:hypothetical protein